MIELISSYKEKILFSLKAHNFIPTEKPRDCAFLQQSFHLYWGEVLGYGGS